MIQGEILKVCVCPYKPFVGFLLVCVCVCIYICMYYVILGKYKNNVIPWGFIKQLRCYLSLFPPSPAIYLPPFPTAGAPLLICFPFHITCILYTSPNPQSHIHLQLLYIFLISDATPCCIHISEDLELGTAGGREHVAFVLLDLSYFTPYNLFPASSIYLYDFIFSLLAAYHFTVYMYHIFIIHELKDI